VELSRYDFSLVAQPFLEADSFLLRPDGVGTSTVDPLRKRVVLLADGHAKHMAELQGMLREEGVTLCAAPLAWTSLAGGGGASAAGGHLRSDFRHPGLPPPRRRVAPAEECDVVGARYLRRVPHGASPAAVLQLQRPLSAAEPDGTAGMFVRLTLRRASAPPGLGPHGAGPLPPPMLAVDYHLDVPGSAFIVESRRYSEGVRRAWQARTRVAARCRLASRFASRCSFASPACGDPQHLPLLPMHTNPGRRPATAAACCGTNPRSTRWWGFGTPAPSWPCAARAPPPAAPAPPPAAPTPAGTRCACCSMPKRGRMRATAAAQRLRRRGRS
jgi:hypothetical protein